MNYQHYQAYGASHYPQYTQHYAQYQPAQTAAIPTATPAPAQPAAPTPVAAPLSRQPTQTAANELESNVDISTLNDALGSAGLDLRAEEETLQRSQDYYNTYRTYEDRSRKQPNSPSFDTRVLGQTMRTISTHHKLSRIPEDCVNYLALALRTRLQGLIEPMIRAANHRTTAQFDRAPSLYEDGTPMWSVVVRRDTKKQLEVLERVEREEEMKLRRERRERAEAAAAAAAASAAQTGSPSLDGAGGGGSGADDPMDGTGGAGGTAKKAKKKKEGPGVTAKNMSEDVQKRLSNATAAQAAGLGRRNYAWMNAGGAATPPPTKPKPAASTSAASPAKENMQTAGQGTSTTGTGSQTASSWSKPYVPASAKGSASPAPGEEDKTVITMRDAMFVVERERGHGGGRGSFAGRPWV
ncbi:uncharacterized protein FOMMEDRAFT_135856 [Fomitiporia mediterranea MF3/22]|uniref:uncharacterized protein n=1 Tax=Fomitiporia mediterranea (strain MF3/22) TaxID=694068 RepID=UPI00044075B0|nr:uncharacterized protein FOMMEDRAFT_135856 [Fomitiporia mediterranea MF3/22]EJD01705.1 hypothetical protein FOMMEDRAFT_135856 [Fomitiporia mediterranea MF3/22]